MEPIVLIHGYSAENDDPNDVAGIADIYRTLPNDLRTRLGATVVEIDISRYVSLDDGVGIDDISLALHRALNSDEYRHLLNSGFNVIIHSTGALVIRNWIRRFSPKPSPVKRVIHLAGANLGSGWAHIGQTLWIQWGRLILQGTARGLAVLRALELGSSWTIDMHLHFLRSGNSMFNDYQVMEFNLVGTQVPALWTKIPIRYGKEDGSDGVVRVSASNLNFHYMHIEPVEMPDIDWDDAKTFAEVTLQAREDSSVEFPDNSQFAGNYYRLTKDMRPADAKRKSPLTVTRPVVPLAIPYQCAHSSDDVGIVYGTETRTEVLPRIMEALNCSYPGGYDAVEAAYDAATESTYDRVARPAHRRGILGGLDALLKRFLPDPQAQYDKHAQIVCRVFDQNGQPVPDFSVHLNSAGGSGRPRELVTNLMEDKHINDATPNAITFYLRTDAFDSETGTFVPRLPQIRGVDLEVDAVDRNSNLVRFVPLRMRISGADLVDWVRPHRTTIIDVQLLRLPDTSVFVLHPAP